MHRPVRRWVLLSIPLALVQPTAAKYLWLLVFVIGFVLRRLEPAEEEPQAAPGVDPRRLSLRVNEGCRPVRGPVPPEAGGAGR